MQKPDSDLQAAALAASGRDGADGMAIALLTEKFLELISTHWQKIRDVSENAEVEGEVAVNAGIKLNFGGKTPAGAVNISFSEKFKDGSTFRVEDKDQKKLL